MAGRDGSARSGVCIETGRYLWYGTSVVTS